MPDLQRLGLVNATLKLHQAVISIGEGRDDNTVEYINVALNEINAFLKSTKEEEEICLNKSE